MRKRGNVFGGEKQKARKKKGEKNILWDREKGKIEEKGDRQISPLEREDADGDS